MYEEGAVAEATGGSLDAAWVLAERELRSWAARMAAENPDEEWGEPEDWTLAVQVARDATTAWVYDPLTDASDPIFAMQQADGPTPAAALRALAARLRGEASATAVAASSASTSTSSTSGDRP